MNKLLYVCYATSDFYARETGISLTGFFENNKDYEPDILFILDYGILPHNKELLDSIAHKYGKELKYIPAKEILATLQEDLNIKDFRGSLATYSRAFIDKIMPKYVDRLLYIDSDTVVTGSISELKDFEMMSQCMAGIFSPIYTKAIADGRLQLISGNSHYYGCGVVLFNLHNWRQQGCHDKIVKMLYNKKDLPCADQTLINNALPETCFKKLPLKYNYTSHIYSDRFERRLLRNCNCYSDQEITEAINTPAVTHYPGRPIDRPWFTDCSSRRRTEYLKYKALTPWKDVPLNPNPKTSNEFRATFSSFIHCLETKSSLMPILISLNTVRNFLGPVLRLFRIFPKLPQEGVESL